ncbi:MAG: bifunctional nuclease family protein [Myxococcales bacterium]|nr:bifunctional nuclease family protein [Myxococcales bacterium]
MLQALTTLTACVAVLVSIGCQEPAEVEGEVAVRVESVAVDPETRGPVVILQELAGTRRLPIWIGHAEAASIDHRLREKRTVRPNSHDLAKRLIEGLGGEVSRVVVTDLTRGIYYARIVLTGPGNDVEIDARPSDAIAIALRTGATLFVTESLFARALDGGSADENARRI